MKTYVLRTLEKLIKFIEKCPELGQNMSMKTGKRFKLNIVPIQIKNIFPGPN